MPKIWFLGYPHSKRASLKLKGKVNRTFVQSMLVYGSEMWEMKAKDMQKLQDSQIYVPCETE
jgi:hypothetical protein